MAAACRGGGARKPAAARVAVPDTVSRSDTVNLYAAAGANALSGVAAGARPLVSADRKSTRLNSSHLVISYAVFCLKKKNNERYVLSSMSQCVAHRFHTYYIT